MESHPKKTGAMTHLVGLSQSLTWPISWLLFNAAYKVRVNGRENLDAVKRPFIIVANHISPVDSFFFRVLLGISTPHLPLRFMGVSGPFRVRWVAALADLGVIDLVYSLFGVFTVRPGLGLEKNLEKAKRLIAENENIVMFPEGHISRDGLAEFKRGAAALALATGAAVLPVSFRVHPGSRLVANIGEPLTLAPGSTPEAATALLRAKVAELHSRA